MLRRTLLIVLTGLLTAGTVTAQATPWRFRWQRGQELTYQVEHVTTAAEIASGSKEETTTRLNLTKTWTVLDVDATGTATLRLNLKALRFQMKTPTGSELVYDSADLSTGGSPLAEQMSRHMKEPLAVLRIDAVGRVVEVKESKNGSASRYEAEPPFSLILPAAIPQPGQSWERDYQITLEPPQGAGEKFAAVQRYTCKAVQGERAVVGLSTSLKQPPEAVADQVPLLQMQPEGELAFDTRTGCLQSATLKIEKVLNDHRGANSSYRFSSTYTEKRVGN